MRFAALAFMCGSESPPRLPSVPQTYEAKCRLILVALRGVVDADYALPR